MKHPRTLRIPAWLAAAAALAVTFGCGEAPTSPANVSNSEGPPVLAVSTSGAASYLQADSLLVEEADPVLVSRALRVTKQIDGKDGGWLQCGRYLLAVAPGAFDSVGTITMSMRDSTAMVVDLEITPARLNNFHASVVLAANTTGVDVAADSLAIYWYDPLGTKWVDMTGQKTLVPLQDCLLSSTSGTDSGPDVSSSSGLTTQLFHFSTYSTGKAGW